MACNVLTDNLAIDDATPDRSLESRDGTSTPREFCFSPGFARILSVRSRWRRMLLFLLRSDGSLMTNSIDAAIAVFERRPYWGPELQRQFERIPVTICECRVVEDLLPSIHEFRTALMVVDLDAAIVECLSWFGTMATSHAACYPIIACGSADTANMEWLLRDAGVTAFLPEAISGDDMARLCRRQLGLSKPGVASH
jgi:hypothetical protein